MRLSKSYWQTYKEVPSDAVVPSHQLLLRAGYINKTTSGIYSYLPMATRVLNKIKKIICEEVDKTGAQEILMSFVTPGELWQKSGRWDSMGPEMVRLKDRKNADFCLSATNEETITDIFSSTISSYKQLPVNLYQINTKFRDEMRPRFGILRGREFIMKDAYTFHLDKECMDRVYETYFKAYGAILDRMGLEYIAVLADGGAMADSGSQTHEFQIIADNGEDDIVEVKSLNYAANIETAQTYRSSLTFLPKEEIQEIETVSIKSCKEIAAYLKVEEHQTLKTLVYTISYAKKDVQYIVVLLGDDEINEIKLANNIKGALEIKPATPIELERLEMPIGYMSPLNIDTVNTVVAYDSSIDMDASYIVGANKENYHVKGFTPSRDTVLSPKVMDLRMAKAGDVGPDKTTPIELRKGIEAGHIFQLGSKYTKAMGATVLDQNGKKVNPLMGCYGMGVSRVMAAAIEQHHDENGIVWPVNIAPFHVYLAVIGKKEETKKLSSDIYLDLINEGIEVVFDDRAMGPGPMFKDADLLGLPLRVLLGERDYANTEELEIKIRSTGEIIKTRKENLSKTIKSLLSDMGLK